MGPVISAVHRDRVLGFIDRGEREGAQVALDGRSVRVSGYDGYFVGPTILDDVRPDMSVAREEIFGPVASVFPVDAFDDAVDLINPGVSLRRSIKRIRCRDRDPKLTLRSRLREGL